MAAAVVYFLCAGTALICAVMLWRGWSRGRVPLLFWTGICFSLLFITNALLFIDVRYGRGLDELEGMRTITSFIGISALIFGLVKDEQ